MLVGRDLQEQEGQPPQAVLGMPLLVGLDGEKKMSKSLGNYIAFNHGAKDMFGRIMSCARRHHVGLLRPAAAHAARGGSPPSRRSTRWRPRNSSRPA
jgi:tyrosyl-tRNA synthetase